MRKLKLIWDFKGSDAQFTARHHENHLREYLKNHHIPYLDSGTDQLHELHATAYVAINEADLPKIRDVLKPHRGEVYKK